MILFTSDLDNTLIYSYKRDIGEDKQCVEIYQGREISFMSKTSYELLHKLNKENQQDDSLNMSQQVCFVPTTTRTVEQYERIEFGLGIPTYALVCNGGKLLVDGVSDESWYQESRKMIEECDDTMKEAIQLLESDPHRTFEIRYIDQLFIFTKSDAPDESIAYLKARLDTEKVDVFKTGIKVYVTPKMLTKGNAILRLKDRLQAEMVIAAGDSEFDLSMLKAADLAFAPKELMDRELQERKHDESTHTDSAHVDHDKYKNIIVADSNKLFSEEILQYLLEKLNGLRYNK